MLAVHFSPFPILFTNRLALKQINDSHAAELFELRSNEEVMKYIPRPVARSIQDVLHLISHFDEGILHHEKITWGIFLKETDRLIGTIGFVTIQKEKLRGEIGYLLHPQQQGKGIMSEAVQKITNYGFDVLQFHSIEARVHPENIPCISLLKKHQFRQEGHLKEDTFFEGNFQDTLLFSRLKS
jgi:ribosomal-protein-alanine N-acetyltransferase